MTDPEHPTDFLTAHGLAEARRALESIVLVASDPVPPQLLAQLLELSVDAVDQLCRDLAASYDDANDGRGRGFQLVQVAGGWRLQTHPDLAPYVERFAMDGQSTRLSSAALETLAIVAYKQPISRGQVSAIRGVNVDAVLRTLEQRGYVEEVGRDSGPGQAVLFGTTPYFLERVGLNTADELPALGDFVPAAEVVEALEQTLKVELDPEPPVADQAVDEAADRAADETSNGSVGRAADGVGEEVIDLRDGVEQPPADQAVDGAAEEVIDLRDGAQPAPADDVAPDEVIGSTGLNGGNA